MFILGLLDHSSHLKHRKTNLNFEHSRSDPDTFNILLQQYSRSGPFYLFTRETGIGECVVVRKIGELYSSGECPFELGRVLTTKGKVLL